jgi:hypothetical protein
MGFLLLWMSADGAAGGGASAKGFVDDPGLLLERCFDILGQIKPVATAQGCL